MADGRKHLRQMELRAMHSRGFRVAKVAGEVLQKGFRLKPQDESKLYILWVWSKRYKVSVGWVVRELVAWWKDAIGHKVRSERRKKQIRKSVFGVKIGQLTSKKSESILRDIIARKYPLQENVSQWQLEQQEKILGLDEPRGKPRPLLAQLSEDDFLYNYRQRINKRTHRLNRAVASAKRRRRRWRDNPWF